MILIQGKIPNNHLVNVCFFRKFILIFLVLVLLEILKTRLKHRVAQLRYFLFYLESNSTL